MNKGLFESTVIFFGLTNSPATFQTMMNELFKLEIATERVIIYMNDILIVTDKDLQDHRKEVGNNQVKMDPVKVKGITEWPTPTTVKELHSFLDFGNYYKDFIHNYSHIARPLHEMTKKAITWLWGAQQKQAFDTLKKKFTLYPVLRNPDYHKHFILDTDMFNHTVEASISQDFSDGQHLIAYFSKSLTPPEQNYNIYDRELLSIIYAMKAFKHFLLGAQQKFLICSNHNNLKYFKSARKITPRQARWAEFLSDYYFELEHISGKANTIADLLSRRIDLKEEVNINEDVVMLPQNLFVNMVLSINDKVFLKDDLEMRRQILQEVYDSPAEGHPGISNTWNLINRRYYGPKLCKFIKNYVKGCAKCQESKVITHLKHAPLQPFNTFITEGPFQYVSMDLITDLPRSNNYDAILTIVDQGCSKAAKFISCRKTIDRLGIATLYFRHLFPIFGISKRIISDHNV